LELQLQALPARVIFREPASWSSAFWINVGQKDNEALGKSIIAKNSPVLLGSSLVGVVEQVDRRKSRVRLITDAQLVPSERALRGGEQNRFLIKSVETLLSALELREELFPTREDAEQLFKSLVKLKEKLIIPAADLYLGKGELHGTRSPLWRSRSSVLRGVGFNCDFADEEGRARDLRDPTPLLRVGDLLVTTGLDGVFPAGFHVGSIAKIFPLQEGACSYELEAVIAAGRLDELSHVTVLPPLE
jgi:cell shape-determining protein MreC